MVKLFQLPAKSTLQTVDNLGWRFNQLMNRYNDLRKQQRKQEISEKALQAEINAIASLIRQIISPLVIRRSRLDLMAITEYREDLDKQGMGFAKVQDPQSLEYDLGSIQDLYIETLEQISPNWDEEINREPRQPREQYKAARYNAVAYVKADYLETLKEKVESAGIAFNLFIGTQGNLAKFMRHLLVQRFESSKKAFEISLDRMIKTSQNILNWIDKRGKVPIFKRGYLPDIEDFYTDNADTLEGLDEAMGDADASLESELEKEKYKDLFEIETQYLDSAFIDDIQSDIAILKDIQQKWFGGEKDLPDPKKEHFAEILKKQIKNNSKRKIVVFSSFADTINDLYDELNKSGISVFKYTSKEASKANKETIRLNFDAGVKPESQENKYDVLVATDAISEGYNLHRAGTIFNYDIPYNPTRVIQRVGRINRINKKVFEELYIYNYFPTAIGETETKTKEIATLKMAMINAIIGEDTKVLTPDIELQSYFAEQYRSLVKQDEVENWETRYREILNKAKGTKEYETAIAIPHRAKVSRTVDKGEKGVLVFGRKKDTCVFKIGKLFALEANADTEHSEILTPERAFELLEADIIEQAHPVSEEFDTVYQNIKANLFTSNESLEKIDKQKRAVLDKITAIQNSNALPFEYHYLLIYPLLTPLFQPATDGGRPPNHLWAELHITSRVFPTFCGGKRAAVG
jgi:superfamily II DNA/RNA helicase